MHRHVNGAGAGLRKHFVADGTLVRLFAAVNFRVALEPVGSLERFRTPVAPKKRQRHSTYTVPTAATAASIELFVTGYGGRAAYRL